MKNKELIDRLSEEYRKYLAIKQEFNNHTEEMRFKLKDVSILHEEYIVLSSSLEYRDLEQKQMESYCNGLFDARELLMGCEPKVRFRDECVF